MAEADAPAVPPYNHPAPDCLPLLAVGNGRGLGVDRLDIWRNLRAQGVDERVVHHPVLIARLSGDDISKSCFPYFAIEGARTQDCIGETGFAQQIDLISTQFFAA